MVKKVLDVLIILFVFVFYFSVSSMITVPVNTSLYQTVVQQISDGSIQVQFNKT